MGWSVAKAAKMTNVFFSMSSGKGGGGSGNSGEGGNGSSKPPKAAPPDKVINALKNFSGKTIKFGSATFQLDKSGMKHILERHHPNYWDGSVKAAQSFFDRKMSINDIVNAIDSVMKQNRS